MSWKIAHTSTFQSLDVHVEQKEINFNETTIQSIKCSYDELRYRITKTLTATTTHGQRDEIPVQTKWQTQVEKKKNVHFILFNFTILRNVDCAMIVQERNKSSPWKWKSFDFELIIYINN